MRAMRSSGAEIMAISRQSRSGRYSFTSQVETKKARKKSGPSDSRAYAYGSSGRVFHAAARVDRKGARAIGGEHQEAAGHCEVLLEVDELHHVGPVHVRDQRGGDRKDGHHPGGDAGL